MNAVGRHVALGMLGLIAAVAAGCSDPAPVDPPADAAPGTASLANRAYEAIRQRLILLDIRPGDPINDVALAAELGCPTTPTYGDGTNGLSSRIQHLLDEEANGIANGPDEIRRVVRQRYKDGADLIKIAATGGVLSLAKSGQAPLFTEDEVRTVVLTAKDYGLKVAAHAHGDIGMQRAIKAGVASIEHGTYMSDETIALMKTHGTYYVPTISAGRFVAEKSKLDGYFPGIVRPKAAAIGPLIQATFQRAYAAGVKIAFGTDQGVAPHGDNAKEFIYMVEAGMPAMKAIQSATLEAAKLVDAEKDLGTVESGKFADLVAVPGDPLADISLMTKVSFVMKAGKVYKQ